MCAFQSVRVSSFRALTSRTSAARGTTGWHSAPCCTATCPSTSPSRSSRPTTRCVHVASVDKVRTRGVSRQGVYTRRQSPTRRPYFRVYPQCALQCHPCMAAVSVQLQNLYVLVVFWFSAAELHAGVQGWRERQHPVVSGKTAIYCGHYVYVLRSR